MFTTIRRNKAKSEARPSFVGWVDAGSPTIGLAARTLLGFLRQPNLRNCRYLTAIPYLGYCRIPKSALWPFFALLLAPVSQAGEGMVHDDTPLFHAFRLEAAAGENRADDPVQTWDLDGWIGGDTHKLWLKSEGDVADHHREHSENWALYSRNVATFWDAQVGIRHDDRPAATTYFVAGVTGLAPYHFETKVHLFASDDGDVSLRLREENDLLLTQKLILQPYGELNAFAQDVPEQGVGSGLSDISLGLQLRYEIVRKVAPYVEVSVSRRFGDTADIAKRRGESRTDSSVTVGIRLMF